MKTAIVKASQLGSCWSAQRFCGNCADCDRVKRCTLPEGVAGRVRVAERDLDDAQTQLANAKAALTAARREANHD